MELDEMVQAIDRFKAKGWAVEPVGGLSDYYLISPQGIVYEEYYLSLDICCHCAGQSEDPGSIVGCEGAHDPKLIAEQEEAKRLYTLMHNVDLIGLQRLLQP